jgi:hypothetical protein
MRFCTALLAVCVVALSGCSTPNPSPKATDAAYEQLNRCVSREQVYALLGPPQSMQPAGDVDHCRTATWSIPHDARGWGDWTVTFAGDTVAGVKEGRAIVTISK